ncbi:MAG: response regulator [Bacteroidetes bacterium]|nr:response regulator [Bacteroidota bacterium]
MSVLKVLVVDDEPGIRSGILRILKNYTVGYPFMEEDFSFEVIEASTGEEGIAIMEKEPVDIVLLDNKLPGIQGIDVLAHINDKQYDMAVMMITSYASLDLAVKATTTGAHSFMPKPFTPDELRSSVENITKHLFLRRMTRKMKQEGREIRFQFLSVLSHELKSPLNAIEGYLKIMQDEQVGEKISDYSMMINRSLERIKGMRNLIMDLLDMTKIQSGKKAKELKKIDLSQAARISADTFEPIAIQKNVKIHLDAPDNMIYLADSDEMEIIFNNLISNAIKYNVDNGDVFITIRNDDSTFRILIEDTGIGISEEDLGKLFQDFVRIKNSRTRDITGSGLGLSIVKQLVDSYGGNIEVSSKPDSGSCFRIALPARLNQQE